MLICKSNNCGIFPNQNSAIKTFWYETNFHQFQSKKKNKQKKEHVGILQGHVLDAFFYVLIMYENWLNFANPCKKKKILKNSSAEFLNNDV